jgi:DNA-binding response OmpR family regulator
MDKNMAVILFNDSDPVFNRVVKLKFQRELNWEVKVTSSYDEAYNEFLATRPELFMTEIVLNDPEGRTGFDLIKALKDKGLKKTVVLSTLGQESDKKLAKELGVDHYFVKSEISLLQLLEELKLILGDQ